MSTGGEGRADVSSVSFRFFSSVLVLDWRIEEEGEVFRVSTIPGGGEGGVADPISSSFVGEAKVISRGPRECERGC